MKNTKKNSLKLPIGTPANQSLFDSILATEVAQDNDLECQKVANRVGLLLKIMFGRNLFNLRNRFVADISTLVQNYCKDIDNELHSSKEDN